LASSKKSFGLDHTTSRSKTRQNISAVFRKAEEQTLMRSPLYKILAKSLLYLSLLVIIYALDPKVVKFIEEEVKKIANEDGFTERVEMGDFDKISQNIQQLNNEQEKLKEATKALRDIISDNGERIKVCSSAFLNTAEIFWQIYDRRVVWSNPNDFLEQARDLKEIISKVIGCYNSALTDVTQSVGIGIETMSKFSDHVTNTITEVEKKLRKIGKILKMQKSKRKRRVEKGNVRKR